MTILATKTSPHLIILPACSHLFTLEILQVWYGRKKPDSGDWVCPHRTHGASRVAGATLPGVPRHLPHHHGGQPWTDCSHLEGLSPSYHSHVLIPQQFSFYWCMDFILCNPQDAFQFSIYRSGDIPDWMLYPILLFLLQCTHRMLPAASDGLWPLCCHMQPPALSSGDVQ